MATSWPTWDCNRSARVTYRLVGGRGERYPEWLQRLRSSLGVYIRGSSGSSLGSYMATRWPLPRESGRLTRCEWSLPRRSRFAAVLVKYLSRSVVL